MGQRCTHLKNMYRLYLTMVKLSLATYNVRGLRSEFKRRKIFNYLHQHEFSLIVLQETHSTSDIEKLWAAEWGHKIIYANGTSAARGVALLLNKKVDAQIGEISKDPDGRYLVVQLNVEDVQIVVTAIYAPNVDDPQFFANIFSIAELIPGRKIYAGDLNTVLSITDDLRGGKGCTHPNSTRFLNDYMSDNDLIDIWRFCNPGTFKFTLIRKPSTIASALMERIDYILIESSLQQYVENVNILPAFNSDHSIPTVSFKFSNSKPGPGYWKFNNDLLMDTSFIQDAIKEITNVLSDASMDIFERWELMTFSVKQCALKRSIEKARAERALLTALEKKLKEVESQLHDLNLQDQTQTVLFNDHVEKIDKIKLDIDEIYNKRTIQCMRRTQAQWYECSERSSRYFLALEKVKYNKKTIHRIQNKDGNVTNDPKEVLEVLNDHFESLFSKKTDELIDPDYLALLNIPQVTDHNVYWLDGDIQLEEIHLALRSMNLNKCPGTDGLTIEFYIKFWPMIATTMHKLFSEIVSRGILNRTAREAVTSLMYKTGRNPLVVTNWRPLSLLNNDYKIYAKVLANRMQSTAKYLIDHDQKGFLKNRSIADNLLNLMTVIDYCHNYDIDAALIAVDFNQAFDSCSWSAIDATLAAFGYGRKFIDMIMICYNDVKTTVMNNNRWSRWLKLTVGVRQGCPLSGLLFDHLISILSLKLKQNLNIKSVNCKGARKLLDMFVDDIWNCIQFEQDSFNELMYEYQEFQEFSGLTINYNKTEILRIGSLRNTDARFYTEFPLIWSDGPIKILGIDVYPTMQQIVNNNYDKILEKAGNVLTMWKNRSLTPVGKIQVINMLVNSLFTYKMQVLPTPPAKFMLQYKKLITQFIWNKKRSKISYQRLIASYNQGGLQLRDLTLASKSLKMARIGEILDENKTPPRQSLLDELV